MKQAIWVTTLLLASVFGGTTAAQANENYDTHLITLHEVESILELIAYLDSTKEVESEDLIEKKQLLKKMAIAKIKSI